MRLRMARSASPSMDNEHIPVVPESLTLVPCPLCGNEDGFLPLRITGKDENIRTYGHLYAGRKVSAWKACSRCGFVHQNPRPTAEALNKYYLEGTYHRDPERHDREALARVYRGSYDDNVGFVLER